MRRIQMIPREGFNLYGGLVAKQASIAATGKGSLYRTKKKQKDKARWGHVKYKGWINLQRGLGNIVLAEVKSTAEAEVEWQILHSFLGFVDRHFAEHVKAIAIHYE